MPTSHPYRTRRTNPITTSHQTQYQAFQSIQSATRTLFSNMNDNDTNPRTDNTDDSDVDLFPSFDAHVTDILRNFLNLATEENDIICEALCHAGCTTWAEFRFFSPVLIPCLEYEKRGQLVPIYPSHVLRLNALAAYMAHLNDTLGPNSSLDFSHYDSNAFASFRVTHLSAITSNSSTSSTMQNATTNHTSRSSSSKSDAQVKYEIWSKRTHDASVFPVFKNDARFELWVTGFRAQLAEYDIDVDTFLDPKWDPAVLSPYGRKLFDKQCKFFWVLMLRVFRSDLSYSCVQSHTADCDGRAAYFEFLGLRMSTHTHEFDIAQQTQRLQALNLATWTNTSVKFITHWFTHYDTLCKLTAPTLPMKYHMLRSALLNAVAHNAHLSDQFSKVPLPPVHVSDAEETAHILKLKTTLLAEATRLDSRAALTLPKSRAEINFQANFHSAFPYLDSSTFTDDFVHDVHSYAAFRASSHSDSSADPLALSHRLPHAIWSTLTPIAKQLWTQFPTADRQKLVLNLNPNKFHDLQPRPAPGSGTPIGRQAFFHSTNIASPETHPDPVDDPDVDPSAALVKQWIACNHGSTPTSSSSKLYHQSSPIKRSTLSSTFGKPSPKSNLPLASSLSPGHPARLLADNPPKAPTQLVARMADGSNSVLAHFDDPLACQTVTHLLQTHTSPHTWSAC
mmetsp:Transcript_22310/g.62099  ORF Transcript_22310/g.62099 Transcript_22310/m.62099 type:complete len:678 (-) Transcript_22310:619-2652(-)